MCTDPGFDCLAADEVSFALINDGKALIQSYATGFLADNVMRQSMQRADAIFVERLQRVIEKSLDACFEVIHRRIDERDDEHFLVVSERAICNDLRREGREDLRLARTRHRGNAKAAATITKDLFLRGARNKVKGHMIRCQVSSGYLFTTIIN